MKVLFGLIVMAAFVANAAGQQFERSFSLAASNEYAVENDFGRIRVIASSDSPPSLKAISGSPIRRSEIVYDKKRRDGEISVRRGTSGARIDLELTVPVRSKVRLKSREGEISFSGDFEAVYAESGSGTVAADLPTDNLKYKFIWMAAAPRYVSEPNIAEPKEKSAGKSVIEGELKEDPSKDLTSVEIRTSRGIVLLNVSPENVPSNLEERPLTEAAKAIVRSGDSILSQAIRRASPKYFGDYAAHLPPRRTGPELVNAPGGPKPSGKQARTITVQVTDANNRAINGLGKRDFSVTEDGFARPVISVEATSAPFNLVLLLDVSGSIKNYVDFIRKAARSFVDTVDGRDRIAIITFNSDVKLLSGFSRDRDKLSDSLDSFDAGGATAYYDALGYVIADTLEPLKGERCAIVVLTDGEDNRSFLPFNALIGSLQESGALVYPLYVPIGVIARLATKDPSIGEDPLRERFLSLTLSDKAQNEGEMLARVSGGVYYPISRLSEMQKAYDDIVSQLRTAYTVKYRGAGNDGAPPRIRVKVKREGAFVRYAAADLND